MSDRPERVPASVSDATRCPTPVLRAAMTQRWDTLTFLHWELEPADVQRLLPGPLRVDTFDGAAWVGLVPFDMQHVRLGGLGEVPGTARFLETNVRTYVVGPNGEPGVFFFSLDAASAPVVAFARASYRLPYIWSRMAMRIDAATSEGAATTSEGAAPDTSEATVVHYACRRRLAGRRPPSSRLSVVVGPPVEPDPLDMFLTARWGLFQVGRRGRVRYTPVEHGPWPLHAAEVRHLDDELVAAAGLPEPEGRMVLRHSPGVDVRIGFPRIIDG